MRCLILCAGLNPRTALSTEQGSNAQELLALPSSGSTARTWAVKGRGGGDRGEGKRVLQLSECKAPSSLEQGTGAREFMQFCVCQSLSVSPGVSGTVLPFNSSLMCLLMSNLVYYRSLQLEGLLFDIGI